MYTTRTSPRRAFTLIEILIVVIILGVLAGIVIPQFSNATTVARENIMKEDLRFLRAQILAFRLQHRDVSPGYPGGSPSATPDEASFIAQLTRHSDEYCNTSGSRSMVFRYGPYLKEMPANPLTSKTGVLVVTGASMPAPNEAQPYGWIYNPELQKIIANNEGADTDGVAYQDY